MAEDKETTPEIEVAMKRIENDVSMYGCLIMANVSNGTTSRLFALMALVPLSIKVYYIIKDLREGW